MFRRLTPTLVILLTALCLPFAPVAHAAASTSSPMQTFVFLFRQGPATLSADDQARRQAAIRDWARELTAAGHTLGPRSLGSESAQPGLAAPAEAVGTWPVIALLFLDAPDFAAATKLAASHPAKDFNTSVEVRPWSAPATSLTTVRAAGPFEVDMTPGADGSFRLDKRYHGDLEATAVGTMLTAMTAVKGSAGYVAIERVTGTLAGRKGSFHLQHSGTMTRGAPSLTITVVPDSGTEELAGLTGTMEIQIAADGSHAYTLHYTLRTR